MDMDKTLAMLNDEMEQMKMCKYKNHDLYYDAVI